MVPPLTKTFRRACLGVSESTEIVFRVKLPCCREMCNSFTSFSDPVEGPSSGTRRRGGHNESCPFSANSTVVYDIVSNEIHTRMRHWIADFVRNITHVSQAKAVQA